MTTETTTMTSEIPAEPVEHELTINFKPSGRGGTRGTLTAKCGGETIHVDQVDIGKQADRRRFATELAGGLPGIDPGQVEQQLLRCAGKVTAGFISFRGEAPEQHLLRPGEVIDMSKAGGPAVDATGDGRDGPYLVAGGRLCRSAATMFGEQTVPLCNFDARITEEIVRDDGVEQSLRLRVEGELATGEPLPAVEVAADEFARGDWPLKSWGVQAVVNAGAGTKDHLRAAIQMLSTGVARRTVYTFTGWCRIDDAWAYLHAGGAIGPKGTLESVVPDLPDALAPYQLPDPPEGEALRAAVRASLDLARELAPDPVIFPLLATTYRAVLPGADFSAFCCGRTGSFKTELAALMQQHWGPDLIAKRLPANWESTANALEGIAFAAKDALLVVDDFNPKGSPADVQRYHREADRLFRAQGNRSGRQRCRPDGSPRPAKPPRGLILSTGEDIPHGHSLRARLLIVEVERPKVKQARLTECQGHAAAGRYAAALAGYVRWLAPRYEQVRDELKAESALLRAEIAGKMGDGAHLRTPTTLADLLAGFGLFLRFAEDVGAIDGGEAETLRRRCRAALLGVAEGQAAHHEDSDPCDRFFALLRSALSSGRAHLAGADGGRPDDAPQACGWRTTGRPEDPDGVWLPQGKLIGWIDGADLFLDPEAAYAEVQRLAHDQGESLPVSRPTLHKRLNERSLLASTDPTRSRLLVRRTLRGERREVLHLRAGQVFPPEENVPTVPTVPGGEILQQKPLPKWDGFSGALGPGAEKTSHDPGGAENRPAGSPEKYEGNEAGGAFGTNGTVSRAEVKTYVDDNGETREQCLI